MNARWQATANCCVALRMGIGSSRAGVTGHDAARGSTCPHAALEPRARPATTRSEAKAGRWRDFCCVLCPFIMLCAPPLSSAIVRATGRPNATTQLPIGDATT